MGAIIGLSSGSDYTDDTPNPNPYRFTILWGQKYNNYTCIIVKYFSCTTFEGNKILVFKDTSLSELLKLTKLDPHFFKESKLLLRIRCDNEANKILKLLGFNVEDDLWTK